MQFKNIALILGTSWYVVAKLKVDAALPKDRREIEEVERNIQLEVLTNGPVTCSLQVYEDFKTYQSGKFYFQFYQFLEW